MPPLHQAKIPQSQVLQIKNPLCTRKFDKVLDYEACCGDPSPCNLAMPKVSGIVDKILHNKTEGMTQEEVQKELKKVITCFICRLRLAEGVLMPCACYGVCQLCTNPPPPACPRCAKIVTHFQKVYTTGTLQKN